jgi:SAM-dependent methyltransferase
VVRDVHDQQLDPRTLQSVAAYDEHASAYQASLRLKRPLADVRRFAAFAERDALVLDAGCGPANDLRLLRDAGVHPVGLDLSFGVLQEARMLLPRHPLVRAPLHRPPFAPRSFGGLWASGAFTHVPRSDWRPTFAALLALVDRGPVYLACLQGTRDLAASTDPVLGDVHVSEATPAEVEAMLSSHGVTDLTVEVRPDPILDRRRPWVVALGRLSR